MCATDSSPEKPGQGFFIPPNLTRFFSFLFLFPIFLFSVSSANTLADADRTGYGRNIQLVEQLFSSSVAARQIDEGDNAEAKALKADAMALLDKAREAEARGQVDERDEYLHQSKQKMFAAMRLVGGQVVADKQQQDVDQRYKNVEALLDAYRRVSAEKKVPEADKLIAQVTLSMDMTRQEAKKANYVAALDHINSAYATLKIALSGLRNGDTLVTTLSFASKEEEYRYEVDRNDTHKMLVNVLLKEKLTRSGMAQMVNMVMEKVEAMRKQADELASQGDYESAIKVMEEATSQVVRLIRAAGIYIPG